MVEPTDTNRAPVKPTRPRPRAAWAVLLMLGLPLAAGCSFIRPYDEAHRPDLVAEARTIEYAPAPEQPVTLEHAIASALAYNLDVAVDELECDIRAEQATGAKLALLPDLNLRFKRTRRSNERASRSEDFETGESNLSESVSSERTKRTYGAYALWNLLDFGLSFLRARQAEEEVRIQEQSYRRTQQKLALDVTEAFWRAVVAEQAAADARALLKKAEQGRTTVQQQIESNVITEVKGLENEQTLARMQVRLREQERESARARLELGRLMGLAPGAGFALALPEIPERLPPVDLPVEALEEEALRQRPELAQYVHREQIQRDEVQARILRLFPHISVLFDREHDTDRFLVHKTWHTVGVTAAWNLLSLPRRWKQKRAAERRIDVIQQKRMALAVGVLTQVRLSVLEFQDAAAHCDELRDLAQLADRLLAASRKQLAQREIEESKVLEREADAFFARLRYLKAYANYAVAQERLDNALGRRPHGTLSPPHDTTEPEVRPAGDRPGAGASYSIRLAEVKDPPESDSPAGALPDDAEPASPPTESMAAIQASPAVLFPLRLRVHLTGRDALPASDPRPLCPPRASAAEPAPPPDQRATAPGAASADSVAEEALERLSPEGPPLAEITAAVDPARLRRPRADLLTE